MSYKIEITASTMTELGGKLLALASQFHATPADPVMPEVREATKPAKKAAKGKAEETDASIAAGTGSTTDSLRYKATERYAFDWTDPRGAEAAAPAEPSATESVEEAVTEAAPPPLDFAEDVAPLVLRVVASKGKPAVQAILAQFGVERASEVDDKLWPEMIALLRDAL